MAFSFTLVAADIYAQLGLPDYAIGYTIGDASFAAAGSINPTLPGNVLKTFMSVPHFQTGIKSLNLIFAGNIPVGYLTSVTINGQTSAIALGPEYNVDEDATYFQLPESAGYFTVGQSYSIVFEGSGYEGEAPPETPTTGNFSTYVSKTPFVSGTAGITVNFTNTTRQAGDLLLIAVNSANQPISAPSGGWTQIGTNVGVGTPAAVGATNIQVFMRYSTGNETTVAIPDSGNYTTAIGIVYRCLTPGYKPTPYATFGKTGAISNTVNHAFGPLFGATSANSTIVLFAGLDLDQANTDHYISAVASADLNPSLTRRHCQTVTAGNGGGIAIWTGGKPSGSTTLSIDAIAGGSAATTNIATLLVAMREEQAIVPVIQSPSSYSIEENKLLSFPLISDQTVTWSIVGGADQSHFSVASNLLSWKDNGSKNYENPTDTNSDNIYEVVVRATSPWYTVDQTILVTVTDNTALDAPRPIITTYTSTTVTGTTWTPFTNKAVTEGEKLYAIVSFTNAGGGTISTPSVGWVLEKNSGPTALFSKQMAAATETLVVNSTVNGFGEAAAMLIRCGKNVSSNFSIVESATGPTSDLSSSVNGNPPSHNAGAVRHHRWLAVAVTPLTTSYTAGPSGYSDLVQAAQGSARIGLAMKASNSQVEDPGVFTPNSSAYVSYTFALWEDTTIPETPVITRKMVRYVFIL